MTCNVQLMFLNVRFFALVCLRASRYPLTTRIHMTAADVRCFHEAKQFYSRRRRCRRIRSTPRQLSFLPLPSLLPSLVRLLCSRSPMAFHNNEPLTCFSTVQLATLSYTANIFNVKNTGFTCVPVLTVLSMHFLQQQNVCSDPLQS